MTTDSVTAKLLNLEPTIRITAPGIAAGLTLTLEDARRLYELLGARLNEVSE